MGRGRRRAEYSAEGKFKKKCLPHLHPHPHVSSPLPEAPTVKGALCPRPGKAVWMLACVHTDCSRPGLWHFGLCPGELSTSLYAAVHGEIIIYLTADLLLGSGVVFYGNSTSVHTFAHITAGKFLTVHLQGSNNLNRCLQTTLQKMMHVFLPQLIVQICIFHTFPYGEYQGF